MVAMNGQGATRGKACILNIEAACNQSLAAVRLEEHSDNRFLFHGLDSGYQELRGLTGDGRSGLNLGLIRTFRFLLPPLHEQRAIAAMLDSIDEAIECTEAVIAATERLRDSLLHELLTRGLPGRHSEWKEVPGLGTIPADWQVVRLGDVAEVVMGQSPPCDTVFDSDGDTPKDVGLPFIQGNAEFGIKFPLPLKWCVQPAKVAGPDDLLISVRAPVGQTNHAGRLICIGRGLAAIRFNESSRAFGWHAINRSKGALERVTQGSTFQAIGGKELRNLSISLPPLHEQRAIANVLDDVDDAIERARVERNRLQALKGAASDALLTGRVRVKEMDECRLK